jgi:hypothetical protein
MAAVPDTHLLQNPIANSTVRNLGARFSSAKNVFASSFGMALAA